jgi:TolB-like protein/tetratricopeptide (TPR) repeat protein
MGVVFLAYDTRLHRQVALKVINTGTDDATSSARLLREARNAAGLNHPHICTIHEVGEAEGTAFIAMEYVSGRSLRERVDEGAVAMGETVALGIQAADALAYAHEHGVVHRDFKAANVIVGDDRRLKVVDFGLARRDDARLDEATTLASIVPTGAVAGTPYAMAPEQVRGEVADARTDIWALGVLLYEMVTGAKPFAGKTIAELYASILTMAPVPLPSTVDTRLRAVIERSLEKDPARRYQRTREVQAALEAIMAGTAPSWISRADYVIRRRVLASAAALVTVVAIAGAFDVGGVRDRIAGIPTDEAPIALAVLPFQSQTGDLDQQYFSDGLTDEMITQLSRLHPKRLNVIARTSSMRYKQSDKPLAEIARELGAEAVLKGSIARSGDRVRLVMELHASDTRPLWGETYDRSVSELFTLEREISSAVSRAVGIRLPETEEKGLTEPGKRNPEAVDLYLRGLSHVLRDSEQDIDQAITLLEQSAALDSTFVPTQAYLARAYGNKSSIYRPNDPQWEEKGFAAVQKALMLDADAPEAHYAQAIMLWRPSHGFPSREALSELRRALAVQPNFDEAWHQHGFILTHVGHLDAAFRDLEKALQVNSAHTLARFRIVPIKIYQQKFEEAMTALNRVPRETFPAQWVYQRAWALISLGRLEEAERVVGEALQGNPIDQGGVLHAARAMLRARNGDRNGAEADIAEAIRAGRSFLHFHHTAYTIGAVYSALGDLDQAQEWIENAANDGFPNYTFFETDVHLARLRTVPRFRAFLAKLRQEWEHIPGELE